MGPIRWFIAALAGIAAAQGAFAACFPEPSGTIAWYRADNNGYDSRGGYHATNTGGYAAGRVGQAFSFNGTSDYASVVDNAALEPTSLTIEAWVNFSSVPSLAMIVSKPVGIANLNSYQLYYQSGKIVGEISDGSTSSRAEAAWSPGVGTWYHVAMTFDGSTLAVHLDGAQVGSVSTTISMAYDSNALLIGVENDGAGLVYRFPGLIDEVTLYNRALSASEIASISAAGSAGKCLPSLVTNTNDSGAGSLRDAISYANSSCSIGPHTIAFDIPGVGPHVISPATQLPNVICDFTIIDGYTQSGSSANTSLDGSNDAAIKIVLNGATCSGCNGLHVTGGSVQIEGLAIVGFPGNGIVAQTSANLYVRGNYIGWNPVAAAASGNGVGIYVQSGSMHAGTNTGSTSIDAANSNLITANGYGIYQLAGEMQIQRNQIGGTPAGAAGAGNGRGVFYANVSQGSIWYNYIRHNSSEGVVLVGTGRNWIKENSIHSNGGLGIDLGFDGVTLNDDGALDADTGANALQNFPNITSVTHSGGNTIVSAHVISRPPGRAVTFEFFHNSSSPLTPSGEKFIGSTSVALDASGRADVVGLSIPGTWNNITATATKDEDGAFYIVTSEFSAAAAALVPPTGTVTFTPTSVMLGNATTMRIVVTNPNASSIDGIAYVPEPPTGTTITGSNIFPDCSANDADFSAGPAGVSNLMLLADGTCTVEYTVLASAEGTFAYEAGRLDIASSAGTGTNAASASFAATFVPPVFSLGLATTTTVGVNTPVSIGVSRDASGPTYGGFAATLNLPAGVQVSGTPGAGTSCGSSVNAPAGATTVSATGGSISSPTVGCTIAQANLVFTAAGTYTLTLGVGQVSSSAPQAYSNASPITRTITVGPAASPAVSIAPTPADFGSVLAGTSSTLTLTVTNTGTAPLVVSLVSVSGTGFAQTNNCVSAAVAPGTTCQVSLAFSPTVAGAHSGTLTVTSNASGSPHRVSLSGTGTAPAALLSAVSLSFGNQEVGTQSAAQSVTISNTGDANLVISSITAPADFAFTGCSPLPFTVAAGGSCTLSVKFMPTAAGSRTGSVQIFSNASGSPHSIAVSGTGTVAVLSIAPTPADFGSVPAGTSSTLTLTVTNTGTAPLVVSLVSVSGTGFAQTNNCVSAAVAPGTTCQVSLTFSPTVAGAHSGTLTVTSNASGSPHRVSLSGTGTAPAALLSAISLSFGNQEVGTQSAAQSVTISNTGNANLVISSITAPAGFAFTGCSPLPFTVAAGGSCTLSVKFMPTAAGSRTGSVQIFSNASGSPHSIAVSGTGTVAVLSIAPTPADFGSVPAGTSSTLTLTVTNTGTAPLVVSLVSVSGTGFAQTNNCVSAAVAPGTTCQVSLAFSPTVAGAHSGTLTVTSNASGSPHGVSLSGTGTSFGVTLSPAPVAFGNVPVGGSASATITLQNTGTATLTVSGITVAGSLFFAQSNTCPASLAPGGSCPIVVTYAPTAAGPHTGQLDVSTNAGLVTATLSGNGAVPAVTLSSPSLAFGDQTVNAMSAAQMVTVTNTGGANLVITSITISGDFSFTGCATPLTLVPGGSCTLSVKFFPTATGARTGSIAITSNAAGSAHSVMLSGNGTPVPMPAIAMAPASHDFGTLVAGTSATQVFALGNTGTASLDISSIAVVEMTPAATAPKVTAYSQTNNCPASLAPSAACNVSVTFAPTAAGRYPAELRIASNAVPSPFVAPITGAASPAVTAELQLSSSVVSFPPQFLGTTSAPQTVMLTSSGSGPLQIDAISVTGDFGYSGCGSPATLAPGAGCSFAITFRPLTEGPQAGSITIASNAAGSPHAIALGGTGASLDAPVVDLAPTSLDFGPVRTATSDTSRMRLTNTGAATLAISSISVTGAYFAQANNCPDSLAVGASCEIEVTYEPGAVGAHSGQLVIASNAIPSPHIAALSGIGMTVPPPFLEVETALQFGSQVLGSTARRTLALTNAGGDPLVISALQLFGDSAFGVEGACDHIAPEESCSLTLTFTPTALGRASARLDITSNHPGGVVQVQLAGTGTAVPRPELSLSVGGLGFGNQAVGSTGETRTVRLTSVGTVAARLGGFSAPADYLVNAGQCPHVLQPQASCDVSVTFRPMATGPRVGQLSIASDAVGSPHAVSLTGVGCRFFSFGGARNRSRLCAP